MKKILIFRSANVEVMDKLIKQIHKKKSEELEIYIFLQESALKFFKEKYPEFQYIQKEDGYFSYKKYKKNRRLGKYFKNQVFDEVYIPSSYTNYTGFIDTFLIASNIKTRNYFLVDKNISEKEVKLNKYFLKVKKHYLQIMYGFKLIIAVIIILITYLFYFLYCLIRNNNHTF